MGAQAQAKEEVQAEEEVHRDHDHQEVDGDEDHHHEEEVDDDNHSEDGEEEGNPPPYVPDRDSNGKIIIRPHGRGLAPCKEVADAIRRAIQTQFRGAYYCWSETPEEVKDHWWKLFLKNVSFQPYPENQIRHLFNQRGTKHLADMLTKVRKKGTRPSWMGEEAYASIVSHWRGTTFKKLSAQNKTNRASTRGGAVHTSGRKAHLDIALEIARKLGRDLYPDELFIKTHKRKKTDEWVDHRAGTTYEHYHQSLSQIQTQIDEISGDGVQEVDAATRLQLWQESAGGRSQGRVYGTADLSTNLRRGATSITQEFRTSTAIEVERAARLRAEEAAARAMEVAKEAQERVKTLENDMQTILAQFQERIQALERQSGGVSSSASRPSPHPHYDDDLDDQSLDEDD